MIETIPGVAPPRPAVLVDDELTDADLAWVSEQLALAGALAVRRGEVDRELRRAIATGRRPAWVTVEGVRT